MKMRKLLAALVVFLMVTAKVFAQGQYISGAGFTFAGQLGTTAPLWTLFLDHSVFPPVLAVTDGVKQPIQIMALNPNTHKSGTVGNCNSKTSPAVCSASSGGASAIPTGTNPTLTVNTTAVTAVSQILLTPDESQGTNLGVTCNSTLTTQGPLVVTARSTGVSFTVQIPATVAANPVCFNWSIIN